MAKKLKCSLCDKEATIHLTQIINNKIHKVDLCEGCAQQKGVTDPEGFALADLLEKTNVSPQSDTDEAGLACPDCGLDAADFRRTGRMGCSTCYDALRSQVIPVLEDMHSGTSHTGKVPEVAMERQGSKRALLKLKESLSRAIAEEAYEEAAQLRDRIHSLEAAAAAAEMETSLK